MSRKEYKQTKYTDELDGPSPMQILGNEKALKDKRPTEKTCFEKEREEHLNELGSKIETLSEAKNLLFNKDMSKTLTSPKMKRDELNSIKKKLNDYN